MLSIQDFEFSDPATARAVPVRRYEPELREPGHGWVLFSVGYGGSRSGYSYLARVWASLGFSVFVVEHVGSNLEVLKSFSQRNRQERNAEVVRRVLLPEELLARPKDLLLVYEVFAEEFGDKAPILAGHSYGTYSALAAIGMTSHITGVSSELIPCNGLLLMSPQPPGMLFKAAEYSKIEAPTLVLTGTKDHLLSGGESYQDRLKVFDVLPPNLRYLLVLEGVEHMTFAGIGLGVQEQLRQIERVTSRWIEFSQSEALPYADWEAEATELHLGSALYLAKGAQK